MYSIISGTIPELDKKWAVETRVHEIWKEISRLKLCPKNVFIDKTFQSWMAKNEEHVQKTVFGCHWGLANWKLKWQEGKSTGDP